MPIVKLDLKERSYDIAIAEGAIKNVASYLEPLKLGKKIFIITDKNVGKLYYNAAKKSLNKSGYEIIKISLKPGEHLKSFVNIVKLCNKILNHKPDRNSTILALGGGVIGDLSGFAASIILRGIDFVQIPTTLLSQVDSSVGGKTGINTNSGKNLVGSFYQPKLVVIDPETLNSLSEREYLCGYVEALKYALIDNPEFFEFLEKNKAKIKKRDIETLKEIIKISCESKARIVSNDERERGCRALLNLGHTFGHSFEKETEFSDILKHGEAVAIGIILALKLSNQLGLCPVEDTEAVTKHFVWSPPP